MTKYDKMEAKMYLEKWIRASTNNLEAAIKHNNGENERKNIARKLSVFKNLLALVEKEKCTNEEEWDFYPFLEEEEES